MRPYREFSPSQHDTKGLGLPDRQKWLVLPCGRNRDSECGAESNFRVAEKMLQKVDPEGEDHEVHRFGHWGPGWFEIIIVRPKTKAHRKAEEIEKSLENYSFLDEDDFSELEREAAEETWTNCYTNKGRIDYIRKHRSQFEFHSFPDMLACCKGRYFGGDASELLG